MFTYVPDIHLELVKDKVLPLLDRAGDRSGGRFAGMDFMNMVEDGSHQLWITIDDDEEIIGATTTNIHANRNLRVMEIIAQGGSGMDDMYLSEALSALEAFAIDNECDVVRIVGRNGWEKVLSGYGYQKVHIVLEKEMPNGRLKDNYKD